MVEQSKGREVSVAIMRAYVASVEARGLPIDLNTVADDLNEALRLRRVKKRGLPVTGTTAEIGIDEGGSPRNVQREGSQLRYIGGRVANVVFRYEGSQPPKR